MYSRYIVQTVQSISVIKYVSYVRANLYRWPSIFCTDSKKYTSRSEMIVINKQQIFTCLRRDVFAKYGAMILPFVLNDIMIRRCNNSKINVRNH